MPDKKFAAAISSPPYADGARQEGADHHPERMEGTAHAPARYDLAVSSPPFRHTEGGVRITATEGPLADPRLFDRHGATNSNPAMEGYGKSDGQLANMRAAGFEAAVSSPPFADGTAGRGQDALTLSKGLGGDYDERLDYEKRGFLMGKEEYAKYAATCNLGSFRNTTDDFWTAARAIVEQVYAVLAPGGHACWVVKDFVRNKQIVPFSDQWRQLCEAAGFVTLHEHHAWVVEQRGTQLAHDGADKDMSVSRKSFFRRLAEKKGSPEINWETVLCMVKAP
jgi:hypothetical protein